MNNNTEQERLNQHTICILFIAVLVVFAKQNISCIVATYRTLCSVYARTYIQFFRTPLKLPGQRLHSIIGQQKAYCAPSHLVTTKIHADAATPSSSPLVYTLAVTLGNTPDSDKK